MQESLDRNAADRGWRFVEERRLSVSVGTGREEGDMMRLGGLMVIAVALLALMGIVVSSALSSVAVSDVPPAIELVEPISDLPAAVTPDAPNGASQIVDGRRVWEDFPTVPYLPLTEDVEGVEIPREPPPQSDYVVGGELPVDRGNPAATGDEQPTTGGSVTIRFDSEPKSLNPVTESSAVQT
ncbi:MAG: hypothetical protein M3552_14040, partial [Planctomycetota bacterium]|nr:hypothetical protein [Planctomycetota bacterium]